MKGTIVACMQELVTKKFGAAKWKESLTKAGIPASKIYSTLEDVADTEVLGIMKGISEAGALTMARVMEAFGEYWATIYAPGIYKTYFTSARSTRDFLLSLDQIHVSMTQRIKSAKPPRFTYEWQGEKHLIMHYQSSRGLVALMPGLIRGLGMYYKDNPSVSVTGNAVHVNFA